MNRGLDELLTQAREHRDAGRFREAEEHARAAVSAAPRDADARRVLGTVLWRAGDNGRAIAALEDALALEPENERALNALGSVLAEEGRLEDALDAARRVTALSPESVDAWCSIARLKTFVPCDPDLARLEELIATDGRGPDETVALAFALAKAYEDISDHERAFSWLRRGNEEKRRTLDYDVERAVGFFARVEDAFGRSLVGRFAGAGYPSDTPVFIVGMPRSGTTLVEQILASHPAVEGAGELMDMQELSRSLALLNPAGRPYPEGIADLRDQDVAAFGAGYVARRRAEAPDALRVVDKHPLNFRYVGLIKLMLPQARILHCVRNPADTCASLYGTLFSDVPFSYDLEDLGRYYCAYVRLMGHWRGLFPDAIFDVSYEELVDDLEAGARKLVEHCGLSWDDRCLAFHGTRRTVRTASFAQVRRPVYQSSVGRWRRYERQFAPLLAELDSCGQAPAAAQT